MSTTRWLLDLSIGPVSGFIAAGRRSRDLWWGSTWLSECARETALWLKKEADADLLVPSFERVTEVGEKTRIDPLTYTGRVANRVRAIVPAADAKAIERIAVGAERRAREVLVEKIRRSLRLEDADTSDAARTERIRRWVDATTDDTAFRAQLDAILDGDFLELHAVWKRYDEARFVETYRRVDELLAARKRSRHFSMPSWTATGRRKSDLDAGRDSVLVSASSDAPWLDPRVGKAHYARKRLGIGPDEGLDTLGLARRVAAFTRGPRLEPLPFPPLSRVAADSWIEAVATSPHEDVRRAFAELKAVLLEADPRRSGSELFFVWCSPARNPEQTFQERREDPGTFGYDASFLFEGGLDAEWAELSKMRNRGHAEASEVDQAMGFLARLRSPLAVLHRRHGLPPPYYALLMMDGDGVGAALGAASSRGRLAEAVQALESFADGAANVIQRRRGCAFYVGGDDLAAYLPADTVLIAARELVDLFEERVAPVFAGLGPVSLSGGVALSHLRSDLRGARRAAGSALKSAKQGRKGAAGVPWLEVREAPRSGVTRSCAGPLEGLVADLDRWRCQLAEGRLSLRSSHELISLERRLRNDELDDGGTLGVELARHRVVAQVRRSTKDESPELVARTAGVESWNDVRRLAAELLVAQRVGRSRALRPAGSVAVEGEGGER